MFETLYYYFLLPLSVVAGAAGVYYVLEPNGAKRIFVKTSWNMSKAYFTCQIWGNKISNFLDVENEDDNSDTDFESDDEDPMKQTVVLYDSKDDNNYITDEINDELKTLIKNISPSIMFITTKIKDVIYYKRTDDPFLSDTEYETFTDKPFVQVEYIEGGNDDDKVLDIHSNLTGFYINGNIILDKEFLEWYLPNYYQRSLGDGYSLRIFDKDVTLFTISGDQGIKLENNGYNIYTKSEEAKKEYEGAIEEKD